MISLLLSEGARSRNIRGNIKYFLGRFYTVRAIRRILLKYFFKKAITPVRWQRNKVSRRVKLRESNTTIIEQLKRFSFSETIFLPQETLTELISLCDSSETFSCDRRRKKISINDAISYNRKNPSDPFLMIEHKSEELNRVVNEIANSPSLVEIANLYLGGITKVNTRVQTSLPCIAPEEYREHNSQTVQYHYDVGGYSFLYVFFYLTDCDSTSGAHQLIPGSHKRKSIKMLLSSARQKDALLKHFYGPDSSYIVEGVKGSGFFEDTACIHRAIAPVISKRLCLQIRYEG